MQSHEKKHLAAVVQFAIMLSLCSAAAAADGTVDPDLEPGFPVRTWHGSGTFAAGPQVHATVGNIDEDPELELVFSGLAQGPLHAFNHDGSELTGWPVDMGLVVGVPVIAQLQGGVTSPREVFAGFWGLPGPLGAWDGSGNALPGWPRSSANYVRTAPSAADIDGDGIDELFVCEEFYRVFGYRADGTAVPGWPGGSLQGSQGCATPASADLDGDGAPEIATVTSTANNISYLYVFKADRTILPGFPVAFAAYANTFPVIGDVDGDGAQEIVIVGHIGTYPWNMTVKVYSTQGQLEREIIADERVTYGAAPALADLDLDGTPDIIVQGDSKVFAWSGISGALLSGWPQIVGNEGNSAPAVGDVDGDGLPDVVVETDDINSRNGNVYVFNRLGMIHPRFPKLLPLGAGGMPTIADIDADGRNEIIVIGDYANGFSGEYDRLWVYDLHGTAYGPIEWGQFGYDGAHTARYVPVPLNRPRADLRLAIHAPSNLLVGQTIRYTVDIANDGPQTATGVQLVQLLGANTAYSGSSGCTNDSGRVSCAIGDLPSGAVRTITVDATAVATGPAETTASVAAATIDDVQGNNSGAAVTTISAVTADVSITLTDTPDPARAGRDLTYTMTVLNRGPDAATGVQARLQLPFGVSPRSLPSNCTGSGEIVCNLGSLSSGVSATASVITVPQVKNTIVTTTAAVSANTSDPVVSNNSATAATTVRK